MEIAKPHEIINRCFEARDNFRKIIALETMIIERISQLPEDDYCCQDAESYQIGAGYAQLHHEDQFNIDMPGNENDSIANILNGFFDTRPKNRYLNDFQVSYYRKLIYDGVVSPDVTIPDHIDPYEVSAAKLFVEGYILVNSFHLAQIEITAIHA